MRIALFVFVGAILIAVLWFLARVGIGVFLPERMVIVAYLKEQLKTVNIDPHVLPDEFFSECFEFAERLTIAYRPATRMAKRVMMADTMRMLAELADWWLREPTLPPASKPQIAEGYRRMFEKYQFKRIRDA